tara:strand:- start:660 stop:872 length:213 start_codon:yes stop_codon:yes gene_type:complete
MKHTQSKKIKVEDHPKLKRDVKTTAIVNVDEVAYERYINDRNARLRQKNEIDDLRHQIDVLKDLIMKQNK